MNFAYRNNQGVSERRVNSPFCFAKKSEGFVLFFLQLGRSDFLLGSTSGKLKKQ